ncbi:TonB-dependent receptor [Halomonas denitrificans]|nr:TonB-dependent receptor [Halomonas denitrificans]
MKPTNLSISLRALLALVVVSALAASTALAQTTSSNLRGQVISADGDVIDSASVEIIHVPSSTVSRAQTNETGQFFQGGLRVGGPYNITVTADGYQIQRLENVYLDPGAQDPFRFTLVEAAADLDTVQVTGAVISRAAELNNGVGSTYSAEDIANQPATDRDVVRTLLRDPLAQSDGVGNLSVGGVNPRFNAFTIDGAAQTDDFGLSSGTYATARSPINLDAVESATLVAADYSVTASDFTGGLIDVVTKSGTNEWDGSIYYAYNDDSFIGNDLDGGQTFDPGNFEEEEYGFTLGGPILKDRLFFFLSYDEYENAAPADFQQFDVNNEIDPSFYAAIRELTQQVYGFDPGGRPQVANVPETSERTLAKLDWNINYDHRASFTYQKTEENDTSVGADEFTGAWYDVPNEIDAYTLQLFSDWSYNFSTSLRVNYVEKVRGQNCRVGRGFGQITLDDWNADAVAGSPLEGLLGDDEVSFTLGCDRFRHANAFDDERLDILLSGEYFAGDHVVTFGAEYEQYELFNLFVPRSNGEFTFNDYDEFVNRTPGRVRYENVTSNNAQDGAAAWGYDQIAFFVQDRWAITPDFELSAGVRYERFLQDDKPAFSGAINSLYGVNTSNNLDGNALWLPRVGFLWTPAARTTVSGGFGLFSGGNPEVWVSNAFQSATFFAQTFDAMNVDIRNVPQELQDAVAQGVAVPIDYIAEDFDTPSDWKASLRFEQGFDLNNVFGMNLGDNYRFTAQYLYTKVRDGFVWRNLAQTANPDALPTGVAPDGRVIYADLDDLGINNLTQLGNADGSESSVFTVGLSKAFDSGFNFDISYAYTDSEVISEGTSSRGISNWRGQYTLDQNNPAPRTSPFQIEDSFKFNFGYQNEFFGDLLTRVDVFGRVFKGDVFGATFDVGRDNALFGRAGQGESPFDNRPLYIPTPGNDPLVVYGSDFDVAGFFNYVEENNIPVGGILEPYSLVSDDWNNIWDLRFQQELPGIPGIGKFVGDNRFKLILDVENFLNLINDDWGRFTNGPSFGQANIVRADLVSAADVAANGVDGATALTGDAPRTTCLQATDCLYRFTDFDDDPTVFTSRPQSVYEIRLTLRYDF